MALLEAVLSWWSIPIGLVVLLTSYLYSYFVTLGHFRDIPAPFPAQFSNLWLLYVCRRGSRYLVVDQIHKDLGPIVRIAPNHVSVADDSAIQLIYGHGNGFLKS